MATPMKRRASLVTTTASRSSAGGQTGQRPANTTHPSSELDIPDDTYWQRPHTSIRTYYQPLAPAQRPRVQAHPQQRIDIPPATQAPRQQRTAHPNQNRAQPPDVIYMPKPSRFHVHWLVYIGVGMIAMLALWIIVTNAVAWYYTWQDDLTYGIPRTFQINAVVGHGDSKAHPTHFIVINLQDQDGNPQIEIIEIPGGNGAKAKIYPGPEMYGPGADLTPITLSFQITGDTQHPEMLIHFQGNTIIYLNQRVNGVWQFVPRH